MLAYLDESGIHDGASVCVIAGYFGARMRWNAFETDWKRLLYRYKVPMDKFHAKSLFPKPTGFFLHDWKGNHAEFLDAVASTIARHKHVYPMAGGIYVDDFNSFPHDVRRYFTGAHISEYGKITTSGCPSRPYFVPFQMGITRICDYAIKGSKVHFFFGLNSVFARYAKTLFKEIEQSEFRLPEFRLDWKERLGNASFPLAKETPQLQAADFLANLTYHHVLNCGDAIESTPPSPILAKCIKNARNRNDDFFFLNKACLQVALQEAREFSAMIKSARAGTRS